MADDYLESFLALASETISKHRVNGEGSLGDCVRDLDAGARRYCAKVPDVEQRGMIADSNSRITAALQRDGRVSMYALLESIP